MPLLRRFPAEAPWLGGVLIVALLSVAERMAFQANPSEQAGIQRLLDGLLLYGGFVLGIALPILSARLSRDLPSRKSAWTRVLLGCVWGSVAIVAVISALAHNVDGGLALFGLPILALICGVVALSSTRSAGAPS